MKKGNTKEQEGGEGINRYIMECKYNTETKKELYEIMN